MREKLGNKPLVNLRVAKFLRSWSSSVSTASAYLAVCTALASVAVFAGNFLYDWSEKIYWVNDNNMSFAEAASLKGLPEEKEVDEYKLRYPVIRTAIPNQFIRKVNEQIVNLSISQLRTESHSHIVDYEITLNSETILSFVLNNFVYYDLALNPSESLFSFNIDMRNGRYIDLFDIFRGGYQSIDVVKEVVRPYVDEECDTIFDIAYYDKQFVPRFALHDKYIEFIFSEYEITPGMCGAFSVQVPYQELSRLIDYSGPLADKAYPVGAWNAEEHRWELFNKLLLPGEVN